MVKGYVEAVAAERTPRVSLGLLLVAALLMLFAWFSYYAALEPIPYQASEGYKTAVRASRFGSMGWALFYAMLSLYLVAKTARGLFALPAAKGFGSGFSKMRIGANCVLLYLLSIGSCEPGASANGYSDERWMLGGAAALVWLLFAVDLVPLVRKALASLRARASAFSFQRSTVGGVETGAVRIEGVVALGERTVQGGHRPGKLVYRHEISDEGEVSIEVSDFLLESGGHRLFVDTVVDKTIVVPAEAWQTEIGEGDRVEVWGQVSRPEQAYRGQPSRIGAGDGRLYVFQGGRSLNRRLVQAAAVELAASASFLAIGVTFVFYVFDLYLVLI